MRKMNLNFRNNLLYVLIMKNIIILCTLINIYVSLILIYTSYRII